ncbi:hypothetical protein AVEN_169631-1 [Araneus ventricosus]|uniref:Uncharacterized protein n=1 Tax=Araneus ventricosus TaxID=182803 RepID=A0A4Y2MKE5_ARAVE|nr:hypothetical protein AVEN_169631-1 [Araneus ventricosus]
MECFGIPLPPPHKKFKIAPSAKKVTATVLWGVCVSPGFATGLFPYAWSDYECCQLLCHAGGIFQETTGTALERCPVVSRQRPTVYDLDYT